MKNTNLLILMADEHSKKMLGCYGHPTVKTPNLDRLAADGVRFSNAYTNSPLCVPARASLATGRYVHETGCWDNAIAYNGKIPGWGHKLQQAGNPVVSIGKLHYRYEYDPTGLDEQIIPMHIADGIGDVHGSLRPDVPVRYQSRKYVEEVGPGETPYIAYDLNIADHACRWLKNKGENKEDKPWVLFVSFICPHFPLIVPQKYFDMYPVDEIPMPKEADRELFDTHPWWKAFNDSYIFDQYFENDHHRRTAIASYLGLCTFNDDNIGQVLAALDESGLAADTRVAYFSDHGDNMGARGLWGKSTMHEESAGIPMILRGPGLPRGKVVSTPVSLVDIYPTVLECAGASSLGEAGLPGDSLLDIATSDDNPERMVLSEYHGAASISAAYMLRKGKFKYVNYTYYDPELYDLEADPEELRNLANDDSYASILGEFEKLLRATLNPEQVDKRAKHDQEKYVEEHGGRENILMKGGIHGTPVPGEKSELIAN